MAYGVWRLAYLIVPSSLFQSLSFVSFLPFFYPTSVSPERHVRRLRFAFPGRARIRERRHAEWWRCSTVQHSTSQHITYSVSAHVQSLSLLSFALQLDLASYLVPVSLVGCCPFSVFHSLLQCSLPWLEHRFRFSLSLRSVGPSVRPSVRSTFYSSRYCCYSSRCCCYSSSLSFLSLFGLVTYFPRSDSSVAGCRFLPMSFRDSSHF